MNLNRTTETLIPATSSDLTTLAPLKDEVGLTDTSQDAYLARQIRVASASIATQCSRVFGRETVCDTFRHSFFANGYPMEWGRHDTRPLELSRNLLEPGLPVTVTLFGLPVDPVLYSVDYRAGLLSRLSASGTIINWNGPVTVTYVSGWLLPGDPNPTLPADVEAVCIDLATASFYAKGRDPNILRERVDSNASDVAYTPASPGAPSDSRLDPYRIRQ